MKRIFIINGHSKEAPATLKETPANGSLIAYANELYFVANVVYYLESNNIHIFLEKNEQ